MNWSLILSIAALALLAVNVVQLKRMRRSLDEAERRQIRLKQVFHAADFGLISPCAVKDGLSSDIQVAFELGPDGRLCAAGFTKGAAFERVLEANTADLAPRASPSARDDSPHASGHE